MTRKLADATAEAIREVPEHGSHITPDTLRTELAGLESTLYRTMLVQAETAVCVSWSASWPASSDCSVDAP